MNPIRLIYTVAIVAHFSCKSNLSEQTSSWPEDEHVSVTWQLLNDATRASSDKTCIFRIENKGYTPISPGWKLFFNQFPTSFNVPDSAQDLYDIRLVNGDLYQLVALDSFPEIAPGEVQELKYRWPVRMFKQSHAPHGVFFVDRNENTHEVTDFKLEPTPTGMTFETSHGAEPIQITPAKRYLQNLAVKDVAITELAPIIPTPKSISYRNSTYVLVAGADIQYDGGLKVEAELLAETLDKVLQSPVKISTNKFDGTPNILLQLDVSGRLNNPEAYELSITDAGITIISSDRSGIFYGIQSLKALIPPSFYGVPSNEIRFPTLLIKDEPRFAYRGQLIDVARNFQSVHTIKKIIDLLAFYKLNRLHFHLTDDEGWRLQIPGLPELTEVGAKRGYTADNTSLPPAYGSGATSDPNKGSGTGFYSREEFIDILKYAADRHVNIIPEINGPGHARAAIKAMDVRYERLMKEGREADARAYLLRDLNDKSKYTSAQNYNDNVLCVCQEYTYTFLEKVISEVVSMYQEAQAPLQIIHTGGDEVPNGAWTGSPECDRFIRDETNINSVADLHPYFISRYLDIARKYNTKIGGWEEITLRSGIDGHKPNTDFIGKGVVSYAWNAIIGGGGEDMAYQLANAGYEVVMCNASNLYFDLAYNYEPEEAGLNWAGYVDTKNAFELTPYNLFLTVFEDDEGNELDGMKLAREKIALKPDAEKNMLGIQGQLWAEAIKSEQMLEYALLPKLYGLAERAWGVKPIWANKTSRQEIKDAVDDEWTKFANRVGKIELPRLDYLNEGYLYRISPPGANIEGGKLFINTNFPGTQLRYTTDGTDPNVNSNLYSGPVEINGAANIKVRAFNTKGRGSRIVEVDGSVPLMN